MSELRKANTEDPYFITTTVVGWVDMFSRSRYCEMIIDSFEYYQTRLGISFYAYVIMPSHIHMIVQSDQAKVPVFLRDFKRYTARQIIDSIVNEPGENRKNWLIPLFKQFAGNKKQNPKYQFWQKTNYPVLLYDDKIFDQKMDYIHNNP